MKIPGSDLSPGYSAEFDRIDAAHWHDLIREFEDAAFYQTWPYGEKLWGIRNASHVVLRNDGKVVSMAQLRIIRLRKIRSGIAYLNWGPLWRRNKEPENRGHLRNMLRALYNEFVLKQNCTLRILPKIFDLPENDGIKGIFVDEKYSVGIDSLRTFVVDLRPPIEVIRQNLHKSWKGSLKFAEKQGLEVFEAKDRDQFTRVAKLNKEMKERKQYYGGDSGAILDVNTELPVDLRLRILICSHQGEPIAALACSSIGKGCFPITGGTGNKALRFKASFLLFWRMVQLAKENGAWYFDTAGVHKRRNPGGYFFKRGLAGKDAREVAYVGQFDAYNNVLLHILFRSAMMVREKAVNTVRIIKSSLR